MKKSIVAALLLAVTFVLVGTTFAQSDEPVMLEFAQWWGTRIAGWGVQSLDG